MIDIGADLQRAFDKGYEKGKADRPQGEWTTIKWYIKGEAKIAVRCPECKCVPLWLGSPILPTNCGNLNYCPHCGAYMKGTDNE